jgi:hypothetical protein
VPARRSRPFDWPGHLRNFDKVIVTKTLATGANCKNGGWKTMVDSNSIAFRNQGDCVSFYATGEENLAN